MEDGDDFHLHTIELRTLRAAQRQDAAKNKIPHILPHERVFPIQIGTELFKLSGASISSDAPSYFSQYFRCQLQDAQDQGQDPATAIRTLYIDRDPVTFKDICLHLQGYHVTPQNGTHFVRLFADAQFYSLPRLTSQLNEDSIFMCIGHREFEIPRELLQGPGNSPNFFTKGFPIFFSGPDEDVFPGLDREGLIRPPSILPPSVPQRSADTFAEILTLLRGYPVHIRNDAHRQSLLADCRYYNFRGLEQRLIPHSLSFNQHLSRREITLRAEDIAISGVSIEPEPTASDPRAARICYARPFVDGRPMELLMDLSGASTRLTTPKKKQQQQQQQQLSIETRACFSLSAHFRLARLFEAVAAKLGMEMGMGSMFAVPKVAEIPERMAAGEDIIFIALNADTAITLDGEPYELLGAAVSVSAQGKIEDGDDNTDHDEGNGETRAKKKRKREELNTKNTKEIPPLEQQEQEQEADSDSEAQEWTIKNAQWRIKIRSAAEHESGELKLVLVAVKLDAYTSGRTENSRRSFLT